MNDLVPDFEIDEDYTIPSSSGIPTIRPKKSSMADDDIMELLWQNGQLVMQSQNHRSTTKGSNSQKPDNTVSPQPQEEQHHNLFMQEDEMASWLHYPLVDDSSSFDNSFCADLLYPPQSCQNPKPPAAITTTTTTSTVPAPLRTTHAGISEPRLQTASLAAAPSGVPFRPPVPPPSRRPCTENFALFSRHSRPRTEPGPSTLARNSATVVESNDTKEVRFKSPEGGNDVGEAGTSSTGGGGGERTPCEITVTSSSPGGSSASAEPSAQKQPPVEDRKRKGREAEEAECQSEDVDFESADAKKQVRGSTSTKRSRAAEVHNLSERRRRDRINEKMRALQELIPRCNKSDKASMLDEAIEYLKSLQLQVQMMSMGCGMVPMMYPGVQQYMPPMGMGIGMGMGMEMGMNRPMMPFPNVLGTSPFPASAAATHLGPRFPMPTPFPMPHVPPTASDPSRVQTSSRPGPMLNSIGPQNQILPRGLHFHDLCQPCLGLAQMQLSLPQNRAMAPPSTGRPGTSGGADNVDNPQSG